MMPSISRASPAYYAKVMAAQKSLPPVAEPEKPVVIPKFTLVPKADPEPKLSPRGRRSAINKLVEGDKTGLVSPRLGPAHRFSFKPLTCERCGNKFEQKWPTAPARFCSRACIKPKKPMDRRTCQATGCENEFEVVPYAKVGKYCSLSCSSRMKTRPKSRSGQPKAESYALHLPFYQKFGDRFEVNATACGMDKASRKEMHVTDDMDKVTCKRCRKLILMIYGTGRV